jgi:hypothetical protein
MKRDCLKSKRACARNNRAGEVAMTAGAGHLPLQKTYNFAKRTP